MASLTPLNNPLEDARQAADITYYGLSNTTGIPLATLRRKMGNPSQFTVSEWLKVCAALGIPANRTSTMMREVA